MELFGSSNFVPTAEIKLLFTWEIWIVSFWIIILMGFFKFIVLLASDPRVSQTLLKSFELHQHRSLDLLDDTVALVWAEPRCITNRNGLRRLDSNLKRLTVDLFHSLNFLDSDEVSVFQPVTLLIRAVY